MEKEQIRTILVPKAIHPAEWSDKTTMSDDHRRQEPEFSDSSHDGRVSHSEHEEYAYQASGLRERQGSIPLWLIIVTILLICWGIFYTFEYWSAPLPLD